MAKIARTSARRRPPPGAVTALPDEVARFQEAADAWWDPKGEFRPLHALNPVRVAYIRDHLCRRWNRDASAERPLAGLRVLDIGCGGGLVAEPMARLGARVVGIDAGERNVAAAARHAESMGLAIRYRCAGPEDMIQERERFDVVLALEVVEHVADLGAFVAAAAALLAPGGAMALSTINRTLKSLALAKVAAEYVFGWLPVGSHDWRKFVRPPELARGLRDHGLAVVDVRGMTYDPLRGRWALSPDLGVNYLAFAEKKGKKKK